MDEPIYEVIDDNTVEKTSVVKETINVEALRRKLTDLADDVAMYTEKIQKAEEEKAAIEAELGKIETASALARPNRVER